MSWKIAIMKICIQQTEFNFVVGWDFLHKIMFYLYILFIIEFYFYFLFIIEIHTLYLIYLWKLAILLSSAFRMFISALLESGNIYDFEVT